MKPSLYNIFSKIHDSDDYFIVNVLSQNADLLSAKEASRFENLEFLHDPEYIAKGYAVNPKDEEKLFRSSYLDFIDTRDNDEVQIFYVPNYFCNFLCSYCYQAGYLQNKPEFRPEVVDSFFDYLQSNFSKRKHYITLFGGEPLLPDHDSLQFMDYFTGKCRKYNTEIAVVTNGYNLKRYIPLLSGIPIREIQVTLDGTEKMHNKRRILKSGKGTFGKIVEGIDLALQQSIPINLRMVLDKENINELPEFSRFAIDKGWTANSLFKTQLGRNYELHFCQSEQNKLYSRIELYRDIHRLVLRHPEILKFHRPAFSLSKYLFEQGELPSPLYDSCPGCKTEWAFDFTGKIYACTAAVGKTGESLGTFHPEISLDKELILDWQNRDILSIPACRSCNLSLACGGGCAMVAKHQHGNLHSADCRPVKELLELGINLYAMNHTIKTHL